MKRLSLLYPIPLLTPALPAAVQVPGFLTDEQCRTLIQIATRKGFETITRSRHGQETFTSEGCWIAPGDYEPVFEQFAAKAAEINAEHWRLSLAGIYSPFSVLRYRPGGWIRPHTDADYRLADATKLTCIVQLVSRQAFSGGTLTVAENEDYDLDLGDAVFFPAQTIHSVSPIETGERYVLACWAQGPDFS